MATVTMVNGAGKYADIFDSEETITHARKSGYHIATQGELESRDKPDNGPEQGADNAPRTYLSQMNREELTALAKQRGLYDEAFDGLTAKEMREKIKSKSAPVPEVPKPPESEMSESTMSQDTEINEPKNDMRHGFFGRK